MTSKDLIDAQFDRAVEIVQSLPKTGPIQTDYEEKLTMYSLYKQATTGNVKTPRPGIWDMLGRAKWDAWAKHRDLDPYEAKWLYVDALLKVLRKYSDKTVAMTLVEELESYGGDPSHIVSSQTFSRSSPGSDSSESTASDEEAPQYSHASFSQHTTLRPQDPHSDGEDEEEQHGPSELPIIQTNDTGSQSNRPPSSMSSRRYRTPMAGSLAMSPPPSHHSFPLSQPMPTFETPSAFAETSPVSTPALHSHTPYAKQFSDSSRAGMATPTHMQRTGYRPPSRPLQDYPGRPASVLTLERAIENVQIHLAALTERLDSLEASTYSSRSQTPRHTGSPRGRRSPTDPDRPEWDLNDLGMWSILLNPLSRGLRKLQNMSQFFAHSEHRSPTAIVVRRLCLDMSFVVFVVAFLRLLWRRSGVRRREVKRALVVLWRAVIGAGPDRLLDH